MRWLCFLLGSPLAAQATPAARSLRFDLRAIPETRDSFALLSAGREAGYVVVQYEIRSLEMGEVLVFTEEVGIGATFRERARVTMNRVTGAPLSSYQRLEFSGPQADTTGIEHDLEVKGAEVQGRRRVERRNGDVAITPVYVPLPAGAVWSRYGFYAAPAVTLASGDSAVVPGYVEFGDSLAPLWAVGEAPTTITVRGTSWEVVPLRLSGARMYVSRKAPRRIVRIEAIGRPLVSELTGSGPVVR